MDMTDEEIIDGFIEEIKSSPNGEYDFQSYVWSNLEKNTPRLKGLNEKLNEDGRVTIVKEKRPSPFTYRLKDFQEIKQEELFDKDERRKDRVLEIAESANEIAERANKKSSKANLVSFGAVIIAAISIYQNWHQPNLEHTEQSSTQEIEQLRLDVQQNQKTLDSLTNVLLFPKSDTLK